jgi:hypothetical protein
MPSISDESAYLSHLASALLRMSQECMDLTVAERLRLMSDEVALRAANFRHSDLPAPRG